MNVTVGVVGQVVDRIEQRVEMISDEGAKLNRIQKIFGSGEFQSPMIVFVNQKKNCDSVARTLEQRGVCRLSFSVSVFFNHLFLLFACSFDALCCMVENLKIKERPLLLV